MDKRTLLAIVLSLSIWLGWQKFYWEPHQRAVRAWHEQQETQKLAEAGAETPPKDAKISAETADKKPDASVAKDKPSLKKAQKGVREVLAATRELSFPGQTVLVGNAPELFQSWSLKDYKTSEEQEEKRREIDLKYVTGFGSQLKLSFSDIGLSELAKQNYEIADKLPKDALYADSLSTDKVDIWRKVLQDGVDHALRVDYVIRFKGEVPAYVFLDVYGNPKREHDKPGSMFGEYPDKVELTFWNKEGRTTKIADTFTETLETKMGAYWLGLNTRYFLFAAVPDSKELVDHLGVQLQPVLLAGTKAVEGRIAVPTEGKAELHLPMKVYFGPKKIEVLETVSPSLRHAVDFGWTSALAIPLLKSLQLVYGYVHNYGLAIIIVTLMVKILLFPLTYKSMKSMAQISKLRPQMERLQKKYADDKQKLQQETWALYKTNGANPVSGCLPMLLQMPIFFALYRVFFNCMELYQAPFGLWIHDLSARDPFFVGPILLIGLMFLQQKLTPAANADPSQQAVMKIMPIMFGLFMLFLPSGLNIYMLVNTAVSIAQQYFLNKRFGVNVTAGSSESGGVALKAT